MGIRGVDIQVAIQRAAEADKIQQGQIAQTRAGEASAREVSDLERLKNREQSQKTEKSNQMTVRPHKDQEGHASGEGKDSERQSSDSGERSASDDDNSSVVSPDGHLDILV